MFNASWTWITFLHHSTNADSLSSRFRLWLHPTSFSLKWVHVLILANLLSSSIKINEPNFVVRLEWLPTEVNKEQLTRVCTAVSQRFLQFIDALIISLPQKFQNFNILFLFVPFFRIVRHHSGPGQTKRASSFIRSRALSHRSSY